MNDITTHEDDGFEFADPTPPVTTVVDEGRKVSRGQLHLINRKLEKMDELGIKLPTKFGKRVYGEFYDLSYAKADELIKAVVILVDEEHKAIRKIKHASSIIDNYQTLPSLSKYWFDPLTFRVISKGTGKPVRPCIKKSGTVVYDLYTDDKRVIASKSWKQDDISGVRSPDHTYKTVKGKRRKLSVAQLYRLSIGWDFELLELDR